VTTIPRLPPPQQPLSPTTPRLTSPPQSPSPTTRRLTSPPQPLSMASRMASRRLEEETLVLTGARYEEQAADLAFLESLSAVQLIKSLPKKPTVPLNGLYHHANPLAVDLLEKMLAFNPSSRISAAKALEHDYLRTLHHVDDEPIAPHFDFDVVDMDDTVTESELRNLMWDEVRSFHSGGEE